MSPVTPKNLVSWDLYDEALLSQCCYPIRLPSYPREPERVWAHLIKYVTFLELIAQAFWGQCVTILDVGCADGRFGRLLAGNAGAFERLVYIGIDRRREGLDHACAEPWAARILSTFIQSDLTYGLPIRTGAADVVSLSQVLRYIPRDCLGPALNEVARSLHGEGLALISHSVPSRYDETDWQGYVGALGFEAFEQQLHSVTGLELQQTFPVECDIQYQDSCAAALVTQCEMLETLPLPIKAAFGLRLRPELAQQRAYVLRKRK